MTTKWCSQSPFNWVILPLTQQKKIIIIYIGDPKNELVLVFKSWTFVLSLNDLWMADYLSAIWMVIYRHPNSRLSERQTLISFLFRCFGCLVFGSPLYRNMLCFVNVWTLLVTADISILMSLQSFCKQIPSFLTLFSFLSKKIILNPTLT